MGSPRTCLAWFGLIALLVASPAVPAASAEGVLIDDTGPDTRPAGVVINEFAPGGRSSTDEFVEIRNKSDQVITLDGWELWACLSHSFRVLLLVFGMEDLLVPGGYLLLAHVNGSSGTSDRTYGGWDVPDDGGWLLNDPWSGQSDAVGLRAGVACTEGAPAPPCDWVAGEAVTRDEQGTDTDDNAADFICKPRTPGA